MSKHRLDVDYTSNRRVLKTILYLLLPYWSAVSSVICAASRKYAKVTIQPLLEQKGLRDRKSSIWVSGTSSRESRRERKTDMKLLHQEVDSINHSADRAEEDSDRDMLTWSRFSSHTFRIQSIFYIVTSPPSQRSASSNFCSLRYFEVTECMEGQGQTRGHSLRNKISGRKWVNSTRA